MNTHESGTSSPKLFTLRGAERRVYSDMAPPPFVAAEGVVLVDRRTHIDRRAAWLREYSLHLDHHE